MSESEATAWDPVRSADDELRRFLERLRRTADALEVTLRESSRLRRWRDERQAA